MNHFEPYSSGLLKPLNHWLEDTSVSEILLNQPQEIFVERKGQLLPYKVPEFDENMLFILFQLIANENNQALTDKTPLLSGSLLDGSRIQLVLPPTAKYPTFSIRRQIVKHFNLEYYKLLNFYKNVKTFQKPFTLEYDSIDLLPNTEQELIEFYRHQNWHEFISKAIALKKNIIISGGTSSGKTTFLNSCLIAIPIEERIITIEDTREIDTHHTNQVNLVATKGEQGLAQISVQDLVQCCLRLRPDRIIMGEIRGKEIMDFISACSTGHEGSITTIHANNPRVAFLRMLQMYKLNAVPSMSDNDILRELKEVVDVIVQLEKNIQGRQVQSIYYKYAHLIKENKDVGN